MEGVLRAAIFPLSTVLFPHGRLPLHVFEPRYRAMVADCLAGDGTFAVVLIARGSEVGGGDERLEVGTLAALEAARALPDDRSLVLARGLYRVRVERWLADDPYPRALVAPLPDDGDVDPGRLDRAEAAVRRCRALLSELTRAAPLPAGLGGAHEDVAWRLCTLAPLGPLDAQRLLEAPGWVPRLTLLAELAEAAAEDYGRLLAGG